MTIWHEERLLIDGELVPADGRRDLRDRQPRDRGGARRRRRRDRRRRPPRDRRGPARVRHHRLVARPRASGCGACASCTRRCSTTSSRCARSSCTRSARRSRARAARSSTARSTSCGWYADLLEGYDFVEDLGERDTFAGRHHRWIEKEAAGVVGAIAAYNYPIQLALAKLAPALAAGCTVVLKGAPDTPWATLALGKLIAEATDIPPGVVNVLASSDNAVGARADDAPRRRRRVVHRLHAGRPPDHGGRERHREARVPRARRQVGVRDARRRRRRRWPRMFCSYAAISHSGQGCAITSRLVVPRDRLRRGRRRRRARCSPASPYGDPTDPGEHDGPAHQRAGSARRSRATSTARSPTAPRPSIGGRHPRAPAAAASSTSRRCSSAPTRTRRSRRTSCSARCSSCCPHDGDDDAVRVANNSIFGLSGSVLSADRERALGVGAADPRRDDERQRRRLLRARRAVRRLQAVGHRPRDGRGRASTSSSSSRRSPSRPVEPTPAPGRPVGDRQHRHPRAARGDPPSRPRARRRAGLRPREGRRRRGRAVRRGARRRRARPTDRAAIADARRRLRAVHAARRSTSTTSSRCSNAGTNVVTTRGELFAGGYRLGDDGGPASLDACARGSVVDLRDRQQPGLHHRRAAARAAVDAAPGRVDRDRGVREPVAARLAAHAVRADGIRPAGRVVRRRARSSYLLGEFAPPLGVARRGRGPPGRRLDVHRRGRGRAPRRPRLARGRARRRARSRRSGPRSSARAAATDVVRFTANWYCTHRRRAGVGPPADRMARAGARRRAVRRRARRSPCRSTSSASFTPALHREPAGERDPVRVRGAARASSPRPTCRRSRRPVPDR